MQNKLSELQRKMLEAALRLDEDKPFSLRLLRRAYGSSSRTAAARSLARLEHRGLLVKSARGRWHLTRRGRALAQELSEAAGVEIDFDLSALEG